MLKFHTRSISYWHCYRICSKHTPFSHIPAHKCVCHLLIARRVLYLSAEQRSHTQSPRHCLVSGVHITRSNRPTSTQWSKLYLFHRDGNFYICFVGNFTFILAVKKNKNRLTFRNLIVKNKQVYIFMGHSVYSYSIYYCKVRACSF